MADKDNGEPAGMNRRKVIATGAAAGAMLATGGGTAWAQGAEPVVEIASGRIRGTLDQGVYSFKGVPFGAPTGGKDRWQPPKPPKSWAGIRDCTKFGPAPPQGDPGAAGQLAFFTAGADGMSEDALSMAIWTPALDNKKRPVMMWTASGGFFMNSAASCDGTALASRGDVVVVSMQHRVGLFGYLNLRDAGGGDRFRYADNVGMLDLTYGLKWLRENIERFGGDPDNIMVFGISGGGQRIHALSAMPAAKGLFQKGVCESGPLMWINSRDRSARYARGVMDTLGIAKGNVDKLLDVPQDALMKAQIDAVEMLYPPTLYPGSGLATNMRFANVEQYRIILPTQDGEIFPWQPNDAIRHGTSQGVRLMVGTCRDELNNSKSLANIDEKEAERRLAGTFGIRTREIMDGYKKVDPKMTAWDCACEIASDYLRWELGRFAKAHIEATSDDVNSYMVTWNSPVLGPPHGAVHGLESTLIFNNPEASPLTKGAEGAKMAAIMSNAWVAFARTGNPQTASLPKWTSYTPEQKATMIFDLEPKVENAPRADKLAVLDDLGPLAV